MKVIKIGEKKQLEVLKNLLQAYEAEFSAITKKTPDSEGSFSFDVDIDKTDNFLLFIDDAPCGFCVKGNDGDRHDIYEFYVIPSKRGETIGRQFAQKVFKAYQGPWQVRQIEGASKAISFWRQAIGEFTKGQYEENVVEDSYWGKVTRQNFAS